jgi:hypothetical protein
MLKSTVYIHLTQTMGWKLQHLKAVPRSLTESGKRNRVQKATDPLEILQSIRHEMCQYIVILDDSWFY